MGIRKKVNVKALDGHLHQWLHHLGFVQKLMNANILRDYDDLSYMEGSIKRLIIAARAEGNGWLWNKEDIYEEEGEFRLPSVDMAGDLGLNTHHELEPFFKKHGCKIKIDWDTESSAWYPRFSNRKDAEYCIEFVNELYDKVHNIPKS